MGATNLGVFCVLPATFSLASGVGSKQALHDFFHFLSKEQEEVTGNAAVYDNGKMLSSRFCSSATEEGEMRLLC